MAFTGSGVRTSSIFLFVLGWDGPATWLAATAREPDPDTVFAGRAAVCRGRASRGSSDAKSSRLTVESAVLESESSLSMGPSTAMIDSEAS